MLRIWLTSLVPGLLLLGHVFAQDEAADSEAQEKSPQEELQDAEVEWKLLNKQLDDLTRQYRESSPLDRTALRQKYEEAVKLADAQIPKLAVALEKVYKAAPNEDEKVSRMLLGVMAHYLRQDDYGEANRLGQLLIDNECQVKGLAAQMGVAAYCRDDFAAARKFFKQAEADGGLSGQAARHFRDLPTAEAAWTKEQKLREQERVADDLPRVELETNRGTLVLELYENEAPQAVGNFVHLVEDGFYDGLVFHRVLPGFMAQGGCPVGDGTGGPGYNIFCECEKENHREHFRGTLSMAHAGKDTGGSQFFITFLRTPHLDGRHTAFGRVIDGLDVLAKLQRRDPTGASRTNEPDKIVKAKVLRKRQHEYEPTKTGETEP